MYIINHSISSLVCIHHSMLRGARRGLLWYDRCIRQRPVLTKAVTSATLMGVGDTLSQYAEQRDQEEFRVDFARCARMAVIGSAIGPTLHYWYGTLDRFITATGSKGALAKLAFDQALFAPFIIAAVTTAIGVSEGKNWDQLKHLLSNNYPEALKINYYIWPLANFINFNYVPPGFRVLFVSSLSMVWNAILSNIAHKNHQSHEGIAIEEIAVGT
uniref:Uncharacterized protein n=1 Tax=Vannella robusta TaxID=1487602 RepID=A0A7S4HXI7_9EUKA|mmetsp:Transcript_17222/g.21924  ORF Transcript_17222/g.21924 Transcript_17222/m.21924 type:complete len:215 (+) Transcript_17222:2-646(+)